MDEKNNGKLRSAAPSGEFTPIDEGPGANPTKPIPPGIVPVRSFVERPFVVDRIMPIRCQRAPYQVWIDGAPYAGFDKRIDAFDAIHAWRARWPAIVGKNVHVVER